ncbi:hypothetical protein NDN08_001992 [Rhodosorus marinus]|uniref:Uncharacterized protein n=1 Tax=Rhodosorus marinus TaxID=101924 RepID=A0AAV8USE4_9RHOD|nr:hypothetical protein NDN08_001992 [Rhodosorus marinus]
MLRKVKESRPRRRFDGLELKPSPFSERYDPYAKEYTTVAQRVKSEFRCRVRKGVSGTVESLRVERAANSYFGGKRGEGLEQYNEDSWKPDPDPETGNGPQPPSEGIDFEAFFGQKQRRGAVGAGRTGPWDFGGLNSRISTARFSYFDVPIPGITTPRVLQAHPSTLRVCGWSLDAAELVEPIVAELSAGSLQSRDISLESLARALVASVDDYDAVADQIKEASKGIKSAEDREPSGLVALKQSATYIPAHAAPNRTVNSDSNSEGPASKSQRARHVAPRVMLPSEEYGTSGVTVGGHMPVVPKRNPLDEETFSEITRLPDGGPTDRAQNTAGAQVQPTPASAGNQGSLTTKEPPRVDVLPVYRRGDPWKRGATPTAVRTSLKHDNPSPSKDVMAPSTLVKGTNPTDPVIDPVSSSTVVSQGYSPSRETTESPSKEDAVGGTAAKTSGKGLFGRKRGGGRPKLTRVFENDFEAFDGTLNPFGSDARSKWTGEESYDLPSTHSTDSPLSGDSQMSMTPPSLDHKRVAGSPIASRQIVPNYTPVVKKEDPSQKADPVKRPGGLRNPFARKKQATESDQRRPTLSRTA